MSAAAPSGPEPAHRSVAAGEPVSEARERAGRWPVDGRGALVLIAITLVAWLILPTAPNYDTATHLMWAQELLDGRSPDVSAAAAPTLHPLWLLVAIPAALTGVGASLLQLIAIGSFAVVVAAAYRLAADLGGRVAGVVAAVSSASSFALLLLAFKAYVDLPFLALVLTAVVVERFYVVGGRRKGDGPLAMPVLLFVAGLLRPEAWALGGLLLLLRLVPRGSGRVWDAADRTSRVRVPKWLGRGAQPGELVRPFLVILAAPVIWAIADTILSGSPIHSLTGTRDLAEELGRKTGLGAAPRELAVQLSDLARPPIAAAGVLGVGLALRFVGWRPLLVTLAPLAAGIAGFILVGALGLPLLQRYLLLPAVLLCVFSGYAAALVFAAARARRLPATSLVPAPDTVDAGRPATAPIGGATRYFAVAALAAAVVGAGGYLVLKAESFRIVGQGVLREARWQRQAAELVRQPAVAAQRCGPISLPTYRFVPELTLGADLRAGEVVSRSTALGGAGPQDRGIAIVIGGDRAAKLRLGWAAGVSRTTNAIPPGFTEIARRGPFIAASRC